MPWCERCAKYFVPTALTAHGECPRCGSSIIQTDINGKPMVQRVTPATLDLKSLARSNGQNERTPWHFKLLVTALVVYLFWRVVSLVI